MSHPVNDELLEALYDEAIADILGSKILFNKEELEYMAEALAYKRFEAMGM